MNKHKEQKAIKADMIRMWKNCYTFVGLKSTLQDKKLWGFFQKLVNMR